MEEFQLRAEVAELYSHGMELLLLDKLDRFYPDEEDYKSAQREELRRAFTMLYRPIVCGSLPALDVYKSYAHSQRT